MRRDLEKVYERLYAYCEREGFAGHDPFDGLNSRIFQATPLKYFRLPRLAWLQLFKRSPWNPRPLFLVEKGVNPKALALFALAELSRSRATGDDVHAENAKRLIELLLVSKITGVTMNGGATAAFGYNFDWQSRVFFAPRGTPAIVPTAFAQQALIEAFEVFGDRSYLDTAAEICSFIVSRLNRPVETDEDVCFSYTPLDNTQVYNASLLAGECLARVGEINKDNKLIEIAGKTARFVIRRQREDGAWSYGENNVQGWVDNFHTAYVLLSLDRIAKRVPEIREESKIAVEKGKRYWLDNFFLDGGTPKYYDQSTYPVDVHSAAAAIVSLCELNEISLAEKIAHWTTDNMLDGDGYFYYQRRKSGVVKIPYMRWGQAWMAYAIARLLEEHSEQTEN